MSSRPQFLAIVLLSLGVVSMPVHADLKPATKTVPQPESPISITSYDAQYYESVSSRLSDGIRHQVRYENRSDRLVTAVEFGLISFDIWNEFLDRTHGIAIEDIQPGGKEAGTWNARALSDFSFLTGVAYVNKVRFDNGDIWVADVDDVLTALRAIEKDFDASRLKKSAAPPPPSQQ